MQRLCSHPRPFDGRAVSRAPLTLRGDDRCRFDLLSLGEVMLRLDPGEGRIRTARDASKGLRSSRDASAAVRGDPGLLEGDLQAPGGRRPRDDHGRRADGTCGVDRTDE